MGSGGRCVSPEWRAGFGDKFFRLQLPAHGSMDLTHRCNLRCAHCYLGRYRDHSRSGRADMDTRRRLEVIDELTRAECLYLLISGGEPLLHPDFPAVYRRAKENGLIVTVFTNATLIDDAAAALFAEWPPHLVEISLYGATGPTYEAVTGIPGSFERCLRGIGLLRDNGIRFALKTVLMTLNRHEFKAIERYAGDLGVRFRFDAAITARFDGDRTPIGLRIPAAAAVAREFSDRGRKADWQLFETRWGHVVPSSDELYQCGAGRTSFHVTPEGNLQPCLMLESPAYDLTRGDFLAGWRYIHARIGEKKVSPGNKCHRCADRALCGCCPGFMKLETGAEEGSAGYLCELGGARRAAMASGGRE